MGDIISYHIRNSRLRCAGGFYLICTYHIFSPTTERIAYPESTVTASWRKDLSSAIAAPRLLLLAGRANVTLTMEVVVRRVGSAWRATRAKRSLKNSVGARPRLEAMLMSAMLERSVIAGGWGVLLRVAAFLGVVAKEGSMVVPVASGSWVLQRRMRAPICCARVRISGCSRCGVFCSSSWASAQVRLVTGLAGGTWVGGAV